METKEASINDHMLEQHILLLACANDEPIQGRAKLQKMMLLLAERTDMLEERGYMAYLFGPHSRAIDDKLRHLERTGLLSVNDMEIAITSKGRKMASEIQRGYDEKTVRTISKYKEFLNDLSVNELLAYIYSAYPDTAKESAEYGQIKSNMEIYILSLIRKHKITSQRGAELLHKTQTYVFERMKERGFPITE